MRIIDQNTAPPSVGTFDGRTVFSWTSFQIMCKDNAEARAVADALDQLVQEFANNVQALTDPEQTRLRNMVG